MPVQTQVEALRELFGSPLSGQKPALLRHGLACLCSRFDQNLSFVLLSALFKEMLPLKYEKAKAPHVHPVVTPLPCGTYLRAGHLVVSVW